VWRGIAYVWWSEVEGLYVAETTSEGVTGSLPCAEGE